jgi:hypothetical protein
MASGSALVMGGDSSESHDTDHQVDDEPLDEMDSPPAVSKQCVAILVQTDNKCEIFGLVADLCFNNWM